MSVVGGENRPVTLDFTYTRFTDSFDRYEAHVYRIAASRKPFADSRRLAHQVVVFSTLRQPVCYAYPHPPESDEAVKSERVDCHFLGYLECCARS
jgi:hypothetical protein